MQEYNLIDNENMFKIVGQRITSCAWLGRCKTSLTQMNFFVILLHLDLLGSNNFGRFSQFWSILGDFASVSSIRFQ